MSAALTPTETTAEPAPVTPDAPAPAGPLLTVKDLQVYFPITGRRPAPADRLGPRRRRRVASRSTAARRSASSASPARARRRSAATIVRITQPAGGLRSRSTATTCWRSRATTCASGAGSSRWSSRTRIPASTRARPSATILAEPLARPQPRHGQGPPRRGSRSCSTWSASTRVRRALSARVQRRPAAAHRHRPGARRGARAHRLRRADQRARRVDPGAGHQPARAAPGASSG